MNQVLDELDKGQDVHAVDAALKRHEAISADVHAGVSGVCASCVWGVCLCVGCVLVCGVCACVRVLHQTIDIRPIMKLLSLYVVVNTLCCHSNRNNNGGYFGSQCRSPPR